MAVAGVRTQFSLDLTSFFKNIAAARVAYQARAKRAITKGALLLETEVKKELSKSGTGRKYKRRKKPGKIKSDRKVINVQSKGGKYHIASAPGEPPAVDFGNLRSSITHEVTQDFESWIGIVGTNLKVGDKNHNLGVVLEFGTKDGRIKPRPFMKIALARVRPQLREIYAKEFAI